jgi:hypothetical protein
MNNQDTIWIVTDDTSTKRRGSGRTALKIEEFSTNVNLFINQLGGVLENTPETLGKFQFVEFEVYAEVSAKGTLSVLGTGGEAGAKGGLKFVFRRLPTEEK